MLTPTQLAHALDMLSKRGRVLTDDPNESSFIEVTYAIEDVLLDEGWSLSYMFNEYRWDSAQTIEHDSEIEMNPDRHTAAYQAMCRVEGEGVR